MIERRKHPDQCLRAEDWGEIHEFVRGAKDHRAHLQQCLDDIRRENKERFEIIIAQIRSDRTDNDEGHEKILEQIESFKTDGKGDHNKNDARIRGLEHFKWTVMGAILIITTVLIPVALAVLK